MKPCVVQGSHSSLAALFLAALFVAAPLVAALPVADLSRCNCGHRVLDVQPLGCWDYRQYGGKTAGPECGPCATSPGCGWPIYERQCMRHSHQLSTVTYKL